MTLCSCEDPASHCNPGYLPVFPYSTAVTAQCAPGIVRGTSVGGTRQTLEIISGSQTFIPPSLSCLNQEAHFLSQILREHPLGAILEAI